MNKILLLTPPMTQLNTPYPATAYLTGFLRSRGFDAVQADPSIELVCRLFSRDGLKRIRSEIERRFVEKTDQGPRAERSQSVSFFLDAFDDYERSVDAVVSFLQGRDPSLAMRIASRQFLPEGPRFLPFDEDLRKTQIDQAFGDLGTQDKAKFLATLYLDDLADVVREGVDRDFGFTRYGEKLAASQADFGPLLKRVREPSLVAKILEEITTELVERHSPDFVALSAPFPGNVLGAFRIAEKIRELKPSCKIILGGGYVNTELRSLAEPRVFDFVDYVTLDDGEKPLLSILEGKGEYLRTFIRENGAVVFKNSPVLHDIPFKDSGTPTYDGLPLTKYLSVLEMLNPMHRLWSDARWNKTTLAHGCYWKKCSFCDVTLDYIGRYDPAGAAMVVDRMEALIKETGQTGFHFVDEAAPPALLRAVAQEILKRKLVVSWWGNIRFEKTFDHELAQLLADSGCIAVSGGLEVASDRLLTLMQKGVTVEQVARVTRAFRRAGILVHAYLMYGFPTQTTEETIDSLERVRQLFLNDCVQSAYWHRFSATIHSPIGKDPKAYGITLEKNEMRATLFAENDLNFIDPTPTDHDMLGRGLKKALYNYMHGVGLKEDVRAWFDGEVPRTKVEKSLVRNALAGDPRAQA